MTQTRVTVLLDHATGEVSIQADGLPEGQAALHVLVRIFAAAQNVVCDQLEEKRLIIARTFKPPVRN